VAITKKRQAFIEAYLKHWNATEAARIADYAHPGSQGHRLLKNVEIQEAIQARLDQKCMGADEVLIRLAEQARGDISEFINDYGGIDWETVKSRGHLIKKISHNKGKNSSIELYDSQSALALIGRHHKLFIDRQEITGKDGGPVEVEISEVIIELPPEDEPVADSE
jgi:phage terminase small subunit